MTSDKFLRSTMPDTVYHYCSLETFRCIIQNKTIRLCDIMKSNDSLERMLILNEARTFLLERASKLQPEQNTLKEFYERRSETISTSFANNLPLCFVSCFSGKPDYLPQWRGYGDDGGGMVIGFRTSTIKQYFHPPLKFSQVIYDENRLNALISQILGPKLRDLEKSPPTDENDIRYLFTTQDIKESLSKYAAEFKTRMFDTEDEYRIILNTCIQCAHSYVHLDNNIPKTSIPGEICISTPQYYVKGSSLCPYIDINFEPIKNSLISEVIIGPKNTSSINDIQIFLALSGYKTLLNFTVDDHNQSHYSECLSDFARIQVTKSQLTYR